MDNDFKSTPLFSLTEAGDVEVLVGGKQVPPNKYVNVKLKGFEMRLLENKEKTIRICRLKDGSFMFINVEYDGE